jgi:hypothetical protein
VAEYADLEMGLHRRDAGSYSVEFRYIQPDSEADIRMGQSSPALAQFDFEELNGLIFDSPAYGQLLTRSLFGDPAVQAAFGQARASARSLDVPLRMRLLIGPSASELNGLRWEMLQDPLEGTPLCTTEDLYFSRYLSSLDWRPVRLRPKRRLNALGVVANPSNLSEYKLAAIDVAGELERARFGLGEIPLVSLPGPNGEHATLNRLVDCLRDGYDILYLVCHGALVNNEPWL